VLIKIVNKEITQVTAVFVLLEMRKLKHSLYLHSACTKEIMCKKIPVRWPDGVLT